MLLPPLPSICHQPWRSRMMKKTAMLVMRCRLSSPLTAMDSTNAEAEQKTAPHQEAAKAHSQDIYSGTMAMLSSSDKGHLWSIWQNNCFSVKGFNFQKGSFQKCSEESCRSLTSLSLPVLVHMLVHVLVHVFLLVPSWNKNDKKDKNTPPWRVYPWLPNQFPIRLAHLRLIRVRLHFFFLQSGVTK